MRGVMDCIREFPDARPRLFHANAATQPQHIIVDCSHGNSHYDPAKQADVLHDVLAQIENGNSSIVGFMLESYLEWGTQPIRFDHSKMEYGVSVTDPCIDWATTESLLREAAERFQKVREDMGL